jgi:hypothetical protein
MTLPVPVIVSERSLGLLSRLIAIGFTASSILTARHSSMRLPAPLKQRRWPNRTLGCSHL